MPSASRTRVYIGSFMAREDRGIRIFDWDARSGALEPLGVERSGVENPLSLETGRAGRTLYAADCLDAWQGGGAVSAWSIDPATGALGWLAARPRAE